MELMIVSIMFAGYALHLIAGAIEVRHRPKTTRSRAARMERKLKLIALVATALVLAAHGGEILALSVAREAVTHCG